MNRFSHRGASHYLYLVGNTLLTLLALPFWSSGRRHYFVTYTIQQIYFTALQGFKLTFFIGIAFGLLVVLPFASVGITDLRMLSILMQKVLYHQLVPFITAIVVIGRSGTSITSEIASMQSQQAIEGLLIVGIDPHQLLVLPRVIGVTFSMLLLSVWMMAGAIAGSGVLALLVDGFSVMQVLTASASTITFGELALTTLMMLWFGVSIATIHCYYGFLSRNAVDTSRNLPKAFVRSFLSCLTIIVLFSLVRYG
ncbi:MAG: ABC transporter permease [Magnetococcales bacterium]|nr:ABC transporter permease [Magnetococcales bacterium]